MFVVEQAGNTGGATENTPTTAGTLISAVGHEVHVPKEDYQDLDRMFTERVQVDGRGSEATTHQLAESKMNIRKLDLKVQQVKMSPPGFPTWGSSWLKRTQNLGRKSRLL